VKEHNRAILHGFSKRERERARAKQNENEREKRKRERERERKRERREREREEAKLKRIFRWLEATNFKHDISPTPSTLLTVDSAALSLEEQGGSSVVRSPQITQTFFSERQKTDRVRSRERERERERERGREKVKER